MLRGAPRFSAFGVCGLVDVTSSRAFELTPCTGLPTSRLKIDTDQLGREIGLSGCERTEVPGPGRNLRRWSRDCTKAQATFQIRLLLSTTGGRRLPRRLITIPSSFFSWDEFRRPTRPLPPEGLARRQSQKPPRADRTGPGHRDRPLPRPARRPGDPWPRPPVRRGPARGGRPPWRPPLNCLGTAAEAAAGPGAAGSRRRTVASAAMAIR
jgi:hypothetical protein